MKIISSIVSVILTIVVMAVIAIGSITLYESYKQAKIYSNLTSGERFIISIAEPNSYESYEENYYFISSLPIIGDTL